MLIPDLKYSETEKEKVKKTGLGIGTPSTFRVGGSPRTPTNVNICWHGIVIPSSPANQGIATNR